MIYLYCGKKGSGKTKALIQLANEKVKESKGNLVYIDDDKKMSYELDRNIRFISTEELNLENFGNLYGFICGILSEDYDIDTIFIDGLLNIIHGDINETENLLSKLERITNESDVDLHVNVSYRKDELPEFIRKYIKK